MRGLLAIVGWIDAFNRRLGQLVAWAILAAILISSGNAILRRFFGISSNASLEMQWYLFGAVVMLCASWALHEGAHVRVDILASRLERRWQNRIELFGLVCFLMPFTALMIWLCIPYARSSVLSGEISLNPGGLIIWPIKLVILLGFVSLALQGVAEIIRRLAILAGHLDDDDPAAGAPSLDKDRDGQ